MLIKDEASTLETHGIVYLGNFKDLAIKLRECYLNNNNKDCHYVDSSKRDFLKHCKLNIDNKDILHFVNDLKILKYLAQKNYLFRNKIDLIRWKSKSKYSGAFFYHADGMNNQISLMMLLTENKNSSKTYFAKKTNKSFFTKLNNFFVGDIWSSIFLKRILKKIFVLCAPLFDKVIEKNFEIEKICGEQGDCYIFNAGNFLHKAHVVPESTRDIMHFNLTLDKSAIIEKHKLDLNLFDRTLHSMLENISK
jgi:hypothetical protein